MVSYVRNLTLKKPNPPRARPERNEVKSNGCAVLKTYILRGFALVN